MKNVDKNISKAIEQQNIKGKILIDDLQLGDKVTAHTRNSEYYLEVIEEGVSITSTNPNYIGPYKGKLVGTTIATRSSVINPKKLTVGGSLELWVEELYTGPGVIITSEVIAVSVNGVQILPLNEILS